jgi:hypothetical protein
MEEVGGRIVHIPIEGIRGMESQYINGIVKQCLDKKVKPTDVITQDAVDMMDEKFSRLLQRQADHKRSRIKY